MGDKVKISLNENARIILTLIGLLMTIWGGYCVLRSDVAEQKVRFEKYVLDQTVVEGKIWTRLKDDKFDRQQLNLKNDALNNTLIRVETKQNLMAEDVSLIKQAIVK